MHGSGLHQAKPTAVRLPGVSVVSLLQARELADITGKGKELRSRIKELTEALEKEQSATSLATKELQVSHVFSSLLRSYPPQGLCHSLYRLWHKCCLSLKELSG